MRLLDRYLLQKYLVSVTYCVFAFCTVFVIYDLFDHLAKFIESQTSALMVLRYYVFLVAVTLEYLLPASLLLATLYTLWQLTRNNELTAMRACGVSFFRIMLPFLAVGLAFSLLTLALKETFAPRASVWAEQFAKSGYRSAEAKEAAREHAYFNSKDHRMWLIDHYNPETPGRLEGVKVTQERADGTRTEEVSATVAEWLDGTWWFHDPVLQRFGPADSAVGQPVRVAPGGGSVEMTSLTEKPSDFAISFKPWEYLSSAEMRRYIRAHPRLSDTRRAQLLFDLHLRLAMPWACLIVTLFGIPSGARSGRQSALTGIFFALAFFFGFYALMQIGMFMAKSQMIEPVLGAWLSNLVFGATGLGLALRMR